MTIVTMPLTLTIIIYTSNNDNTPYHVGNGHQVNSVMYDVRGDHDKVIKMCNKWSVCVFFFSFIIVVVSMCFCLYVVSCQSDHRLFYFFIVVAEIGTVEKHLILICLYYTIPET